MKKSFLLTCCASLFSLSTLLAQIIFVDQSATGANNGSSWLNAFVDLQEALAASTAGDSLWIAKGTYFPTRTTDRSIYFDIPTGVALFGGFAGEETTITERDYEENTTTWSGQISADSASYLIAYLLNPNKQNVVDGITFERSEGIFTVGIGIGDTDKRKGGGLLIEMNDSTLIGQPIIRNCTFQENRLDRAGALAFGSNYPNLIPQIENCTFRFNQGTYATNIDFILKAHPDLPIQITNCYFEQKEEETEEEYLIEGIRMYHFFNNSNSINIEIDSCEFVKMKTGIGFYLQDYLTEYNDLIPNQIRITNCMFNSNRSLVGSGINISSHRGTITIQNCEFTDNRRPYFLCADYCDYYPCPCNFGGAINIANFDSLATARIEYCSFFDNESGDGGAIRGGGNLLISNSVFANNSSHAFGGSLSFYNGNSTISSVVDLLNCTFYNGQADFGDLFSSGSLYSFEETINPKINFKNCIIQQVETTSRPFIGTSRGGEITFNNCLLDIDSCELLVRTYSNRDSVQLNCNNNIFNTNADFRAVSENDFRLKPCSAGVNSGNNSFSNSTVDLQQTERIKGGQIDIGAYETDYLNLSIAEQQMVSCNGGMDGSVILNVENVNGSSSIAYQNRVTTSNIIENLAAGTYEFTLRDSTDCTSTIEVEITEPDPIFLVSDILNASTNGSADGRIRIDEVRNGTPPFTYAWSNGATTAIAENLVMGNYTVTVTDANGCEGIKDFMIDFNTATVDVLSKGFKIYPTLATDEIFIENEFNIAVIDIELWSIQGKQILQLMDSSVISIKDLGSGIYVLKINTPSGVVMQQIMKK